MNIRIALLSLLVGFLAASPSAGQEATATYGPESAPQTLTLRGTTDIAAFSPVMLAFLTENPNLQIRYEQWGSNDLFALTQADCVSGQFGADMVISSAIDLQVKLVNDACAQPYRSSLTDLLPATSRWRDEIWGVTREPAVIVYNNTLLSAEEAPTSRFDLLDLLRTQEDRFRGNVATYDIEASGLGYLFAFADSQQASTFGALLESFGRTDAVATCCSAEIITGVAEGEYLIAYNVLGSYALNRAADDPRIAIVLPSDYTLMLTRVAIIPAAATEPERAGAFLDFMLSDSGKRALMSANLLVSLSGSDTEGSVLEQPVTSSVRPIPLSPALLVGSDAHKRMLLLERWRGAFSESTGK
ncbi:MAG TPA: ABC transporter substrate-binding protein [Paracoccaceae bacterium]|nr:ABC transporter substrate-binding protein [Paracoccaceae bacterium]